jgi:uncharacterized membrane protein YvbJ
MSHPTLYCPACGTENAETLQRCTACSAWLDPAMAAMATKSVSTERPFDVKAFGIAAAVAVALVVLAQVAGVTFSMAVLPASDSMVEHFEHLDALVEAEAIERDECVGS